MSRELRPWELLGSRLLLERLPWFSVHQESVRLPSGRVLDDFYRIVLPDYAIVAAVTTDGQLVLVRGYKQGLGRVSLSAPAGHLEPGEDPLAGAQRELREETGYTAPEWTHLGTFLTDGNRHCGHAHLFLARGAVRADAEPPHDDAEEVQVELLPPARLLEVIRSGDVAVLPAVAVLALAALAAPAQ